MEGRGNRETGVASGGGWERRGGAREKGRTEEGNGEKGEEPEEWGRAAACIFHVLVKVPRII